MGLFSLWGWWPASKRVEKIRNDFADLGAELVVDEYGLPLAFRGEYDALQRCTDAQWLYKWNSHAAGHLSPDQVTVLAELPASKAPDRLFFVLNGKKPGGAKFKIVGAFLSEFYDVERTSTRSKKSICLVEESQASSDERTRVERKWQLQRERIMEIALANIETRTKDDVQPSGGAVYVMASEHGAKIGISNEPEKRLGQVQTGHPARVKLSKVFWFFNREEAASVEQAVHRQLKLRRVHTSGEWFKVRGNEAELVISEIIRELTQEGKIEIRFRDVRNSSSQIDMMIAECVSKEWRVSHRRNEWLRFGDKRITVFRKQAGWCYVYDDRFATESFDSTRAAKVAALQKHLEEVGSKAFSVDILQTDAQTGLRPEQSSLMRTARGTVETGRGITTRSNLAVGQ